MSPRPHTRRPGAQRGFTLIELVVVLALLVIVISGVAYGITNVRRADLRASAGMMGAAMRYMYNLAVINNTPYRLVIDMNEGKFWGEEMKTEDPCDRYLPDEDEIIADVEQEAARAKAEAAGADGEAAAARVIGIDRAGKNGARSGPASFSKPKDNLLSTRKLPTGVVVTGVMTSPNAGPKRTGKAAIHFFPGGFAERAYVWLGEREGGPDGDAEPSLTIELESLMGVVTRHPKVLDEREFAKEKL